MNVKKETTTSLKCLIERIDFELQGRTENIHVPIAIIQGSGDIQYFDINNVDKHSEHIINQVKNAIKEKNTAFKISMTLMPESNYNILKEKNTFK